MAAKTWRGLSPPAGPALAVALLALITVGGTLGYRLIEGWSLWDAFYMTVITLTTVGYREVHELSRAGEAFTIVLLMGGVGAALYTFSQVAAVVVEGGLRAWFGRRHQGYMLDHLRDHFIICGYGRIGGIVSREFQRQGTPFVIIERDPERVHEAIEAGCLALAADASSEEVLKRANIDFARGLIAAVSTDAENVYAVLTARGLRPDLFIVGRAESDDATRKLLRAGANRVISPYRIGALQMAQTALRPAVVEFVELATSSENLDLAMEQVRIAPGSTLAGRTLLAADLQRLGVLIVGIQRGDGRMEFNPPPEATMAAEDRLIVFGRPDNLRQLEVAAGVGG